MPFRRKSICVQKLHYILEFAEFCIQDSLHSIANQCKNCFKLQHLVRASGRLGRAKSGKVCPKALASAASPEEESSAGFSSQDAMKIKAVPRAHMHMQYNMYKEAGYTLQKTKIQCSLYLLTEIVTAPRALSVTFPSASRKNVQRAALWTSSPHHSQKNGWEQTKLYSEYKTRARKQELYLQTHNHK